MRLNFGGTAVGLLCLPLFLAGLSSCHQTQPQRISDLDPQRRGDPESLMKEFRENAEGVKKASMKATGAPVHVDTSVPPPTDAAPHHEHAPSDPKGC